MKVLVVINELELGGAERLVHDQLIHPAFTADVKVICLDRMGPLAESLLARGVDVQLLGMRGRLDIRAIPRLRRVFRAWCPDVVHLHLARSGILGRLASVRMPHRLVYTEHNIWSRYPRLIRHANASTFHLNHGVAAVSKAVRDQILAGLRWPPDTSRVAVIGNAVDVDQIEKSALTRSDSRHRMGVPDDALVVGNIANLFARKGQEFLIMAAAEICRRDNRVRFVVIGEGDEREALERQIHRLGLEEHVLLLGAVRDAYRLLRGFDVFVLSSRFEGMPVALLEAMALGIPAVATSVGGIPEVIIQGETGIVVPPEDVSSLEAALTRFLSDAEFRRSAGEAARRRVAERYSMPAFVQAYDALYRSVLGNLHLEGGHVRHSG